MPQQINKPGHNDREPQFDCIEQSFRQLRQFGIPHSHDRCTSSSLCDHLHDTD